MSECGGVHRGEDGVWHGQGPHACLSQAQQARQEDSAAPKQEVEEASKAAAAAVLLREDQAVIADLEQQGGADPEELDKAEAEAAAL